MLLVERGLVESREKARRLILAGRVTDGKQRLSKPGIALNPDSRLELTGTARYVSRGGDKLEGFFAGLDFTPRGMRCLDIGGSTGGFTDFLLQHGARSVVAVDVGHGILHWKLRNDSRVTVLERCNARYLDAARAGRDFDLAVVDVSFISLTKILPAVIPLLARGGSLVCLVKPQFEAGRGQVGRGGVVRSEAVREECIEKIVSFCAGRGLSLEKHEPCRLKGPAGNREHFAWFVKPLSGAPGNASREKTEEARQ